jgi:hypothetical protein
MQSFKIFQFFPDKIKIKPRKGAPFDNSNSSEKKNHGMSNLGDLPGFKNHNVP